MPARERVPSLTGPEVDLAATLRSAPLTITGRLLSASNVVFAAVVQGEAAPDMGRVSTAGPGPGGDSAPVRCVYKPVAGEKPLWDFPGSVLARHEVAASEICRLMGREFVPLAVWREDGPAGPGVVVAWVDEAVSDEVGVFPVDGLPAGWLPVLRGTDERDREVLVAHRDTPSLAEIAVFDAIINNSDRKAGHLLGQGAAVRAIDHGVAFHHEWKLRTVLWGFAGRELTTAQRAMVARVVATVDDPHELARSAPSVAMLGELARSGIATRCHELLHSGVFPQPQAGWPVVPWPLW